MGGRVGEQGSGDGGAACPPPRTVTPLSARRRWAVAPRRSRSPVPTRRQNSPEAARRCRRGGCRLGAGSGMGTVPDGAHPPTPLRGSVGSRAHRRGGRGCPDLDVSREIKQVEPPLAGVGSAQPSQPCSPGLNSAGDAGQRPCLARRWLLSCHRCSPAAGSGFEAGSGVWGGCCTRLYDWEKKH